MSDTPSRYDAAIAPFVAAPQHGPRPLPLFLDILWRETQGDRAFRARALAGLRRYQEARRPERPEPAHVAAEAGSARLLHFGTEMSLDRPPVILVPSLINPAEVLDLSREQSLARWLAAQGQNAYLVDWGSPASEDRGRDLTGHVTERLLPLVAQLDDPPLYVGYCLGGTLTIAAAAAAAARAVVAIATPWSFDRFPDDSRAEIAKLWADSRPLCERLGYVPMEVLQSGFWGLDPARTIRKYAAFADMEPGSTRERAFITLEDWANEGAPLTFAAARQLFEDFYAANMTGNAAWEVGGVRVDAAALPCPSLSIGSSTDRIVPAVAAPPLAETRILELGHVGMIVGGRARERLWEPLAAWLFKHGA